MKKRLLTHLIALCAACCVLTAQASPWQCLEDWENTHATFLKQSGVTDSHKSIGLIEYFEFDATKNPFNTQQGKHTALGETILSESGLACSCLNLEITPQMIYGWCGHY
ncbi:MAG: hypothetical protein ACRC5A_13105 [Enterobacteriaceae bacterium]